MTIKRLYGSWLKRNAEKTESREKITTSRTSERSRSSTIPSRESMAIPPSARQRKITVVSIASNQHGLKIESDQELRNRSVSTIRLEKVISEIKEFHSRTEMQLRKSVRKQAKELGFFFCFFVIYIMFGSFLFFYIEECSGATVANDGSVFNKHTKTRPAEFKNITKTCNYLFTKALENIQNNNNNNNNSINSNNTTSILSLHESFQQFYNSCEDILKQSVLPVITIAKRKQNCSVNEYMLLKYAEFTIFTLLTIGYGNTTPVTITGRMCLIFYAVIGIPLAVTMYSVAGKLIVQIITLVIRMIQSRFFKLSKEVKHIQMKTLAVSVFFMVTILLIGCSITTTEQMEDLDFLSSLYFWFVSLTTIGYGDIHFERDKHLANPHLLIISAGNILFGLGVMAAIIEAFSLALEKKDLQMSTIIIDEEGLSQAEVELHKNNLGVALDRYRLNALIDETEYETNLTDLSSNKDSNSENSMLNHGSYHQNGHTNLAQTSDDGILLTDYIATSEECLHNNNIKWKLTEPDVIKNS